MRMLALVIALGIASFHTGCGMPVRPASEPDRALPAQLLSTPTPQGERGPWDADRLKAAEARLQARPTTDLDKQRQALAAAYIYWGDALFKEFITPQEKTALTDEPPPASAFVTSPPLWYWTDKQQQQLDQMLQQQRNQYYRDRQPPPQFPRAPICNSTTMGGQVYTHCY